MLTFGFTTEVDPGPLPDLASRLDQPRGVLADLADAVADYQRDVFDTSGLGTWPANDPMTLALKRGSRPMIDTGDLLREMTSAASARLTGDAVEITTTHKGAVMNARGANGAPVRDVSPTPTARHLDAWTEAFLQSWIGGL